MCWFFFSRPALRKRIVSLFVWTSAAAEKNTRSAFCHCLDPEAKSHKFELAPRLFCVLANIGLTPANNGKAELVRNLGRQLFQQMISLEKRRRFYYWVKRRCQFVVPGIRSCTGRWDFSGADNKGVSGVRLSGGARSVFTV